MVDPVATPALAVVAAKVVVVGIVTTVVALAGYLSASKRSKPEERGVDHSVRDHDLMSEAIKQGRGVEYKRTYCKKTENGMNVSAGVSAKGAVGRTICETVETEWRIHPLQNGSAASKHLEHPNQGSRGGTPKKQWKGTSLMRYVCCCR